MENRIKLLYRSQGFDTDPIQLAFFQTREEDTEIQDLVSHFLIAKLEAKLRVNIVLEAGLTGELLDMRLKALESKYSETHPGPSVPTRVKPLQLSADLLRAPTTKDIRIAIINFRKLNTVDETDLLWAVTTPENDLLPSAFKFCHGHCSRLSIDPPSEQNPAHILACLYETWLRLSWPTGYPPLNIYHAPTPRLISVPPRVVDEGDSDQSDATASDDEEEKEEDDEGWESVTATQAAP
ncbi:hypothetical protein EDB80DRAFT_717324, partial [Ilyonectria destructans]